MKPCFCLCCMPPQGAESRRCTPAYASLNGARICAQREAREA
jgi:hypothetical protein